jgi:hypothetical protein
VSSTISAAADTSTAGSKSLQLTGVDLAGNSTPVTCAYSVAEPPPEPTAAVSIATPTADPTFSATSPFLALAGTASAGDDDTVASVAWSNDRGGSGTAAGAADWSVAAVPLQTGVNVITVTVTTAAGATATDTLTVTFDALTYFLAEGSTGPFFTMDVALANPHATPARITLTFLKGDGSTVVEGRTLPPTSRTTIAVRDIEGLAETPLSTIVSSLDLLPIGVERTMAWDARAYGGHGETAIAQPRTKWYFGEGSSGFFHTYVLVVNPNAAATTATVTFMPESGDPVVRTYPMEALSRLVVDAGSISELTDRSFGFTVEATQPIAVDRSMYFGGAAGQIFAGGHAAAGAPDPSLTWYFAEGATGTFFDTYFLLSNPGALPATATLTYLLTDGTTVTEERTIAADARVTVSVESGDPRLADAAFSTQVVSTAPIVAERSMYWGRAGASLPWIEGHNSLGLTAPGPRWLLAEGRVGGPLAHQTYILLGNPSSSAAEVTVTYLREDGSVVTKPYLVPPTSRVNVHVNGEVTELQNEPFAASVAVTNGVSIFVERSLYWNADGVTWAGGTNAPASRMP